MARFGRLVLICPAIVLAAICLPEPVADAAGEVAEAVAYVQVLQDDLPLTHVQVIFSRSIAGRVDSAQWTGVTDAAGRATVRVVSGSGYYLERAMDANGAEIGRWHSGFCRFPSACSGISFLDRGV